MFYYLYPVWRQTLISFLWCSTISTLTGSGLLSPFCGVLLSLSSLEADPHLLSVVFYYLYPDWKRGILHHLLSVGFYLYPVWRQTLVSCLWCSTISTQSGGRPSSPFCGVLLSLPILEANPRSSPFCGVLSLPSLEAEPRLLSVVFYYIYPVWKRTLISFLWCSTISIQSGGRPSSPFCGVLLSLPRLEADPRSSPFCGVLSLPSLEADPCLLSVVFYYLYPVWRQTLISFLWCSTISTLTGSGLLSPFCGVLLSLPSLEADPRLLSVVFYYLYPVWKRSLVSFLWGSISTQSGGGASSPFCGVLLSLLSLEVDPCLLSVVSYYLYPVWRQTLISFLWCSTISTQSRSQPSIVSFLWGSISTQSGGGASSPFCGVLLSLPSLEADPRSSPFCGVLSLPSLEAEPCLLSVVFYYLYPVWKRTLDHLLSVGFYLYPVWRRSLISFLWCSTISTQSRSQPSIISFLWGSISTQSGGGASSPFCGVLLSLPSLEANPRSSPFCGVLSLPSLEAEPHLLSVVFYYLYPVWKRTLDHLLSVGFYLYPVWRRSLISFLWCSTISTQSGSGPSIISFLCCYTVFT